MEKSGLLPRRICLDVCDQKGQNRTGSLTGEAVRGVVASAPLRRPSIPAVPARIGLLYFSLFLQERSPPSRAADARRQSRATAG
jgi:hypothetical protein